MLQMLHILLVTEALTVRQQISYEAVFNPSFQPGRSNCIVILWNSVRNLQLLSSCATVSPPLLVTASGAGKNPPGMIVFNADLIGAQHSLLSHLTTCKKYWLART